jgi:hypothetical protein
MQIMPVLKFWFAHGSQIEALAGQGGSKPGETHVIVSLVAAVMPFAKLAWPVLAQNNLGDDFVAMLRDALATTPATPQRDVTTV